MRRLLRALISRFDGRDLAVLTALLLIGGGLSLVSLAAALIVPGLLLFLLAVWPLISASGGPPRGDN